MKKFAVIIAFVLLASLAASAQSFSTDMKAKIPFAFVAADTTLPAGDYQFTRVSDSTIKVTNMQTHKSVLATVLTRLAATDHPTSVVSFDVVGDKHILETLSPMGDDGYLFAMTKEKHTHHKVTAS